MHAGVILNRDPYAHMKYLKPSPPASELVDRCIECGFCESNCPSRDTTLTPRQRITTYREMSRLNAMPSRTPQQDARSVVPPTLLVSCFNVRTCLVTVLWFQALHCVLDGPSRCYDLLVYSVMVSGCAFCDLYGPARCGLAVSRLLLGGGCAG